MGAYRRGKIAETKRQWEMFREEVVGSDFWLRSGFNHCPPDRGMGRGARFEMEQKYVEVAH